MSIQTFSRFLKTATTHLDLLRDLAGEDDIVSRASLLSYLEHAGIAPGEKDRAIDGLCQSGILFLESEQTYSLNPVVANLINYYERRGRLTSATFLRDQILSIAQLTDELQRQLFNEDTPPQSLTDTMDSLYHLVREVRESGDGHYQACMHLLGNVKRQAETMSLDQRLIELETVQRRHIMPLDELVNPGSEYTHKIRQLKRHIAYLGQNQLLLAQSQELDSRQRRLLVDLNYIDQNLLAHFVNASDTARSLIKSLLEEKGIKNAVAACLGNLDTVWDRLADYTLLATGRRTAPIADRDSLESFFGDIIHRRLLPQPTPLMMPEAKQTIATAHLVPPARIWQVIQDETHIKSWPEFVVNAFSDYISKEQLKAIAFPLSNTHPQVQIGHHKTTFIHHFDTFGINLSDFAVSWSQSNDHRSS